MANTIDNAFQNLYADTATQKKSKNFSVPTGAGSWLTLNLDPDRKYLLRNMAFDAAGADSVGKIKLVYGSTEPDVTVFAGDADTEWMKAVDVAYPLRGTQQISFKADAAVVLLVRVIERSVAGHEG